MTILAIDPGYERLGIAVIEKDTQGKEILLYSDCFKTSAKLPFSERLLALGLEIERVISAYKPQALAIEKLYFTNNQKTAMNVAEVKGTITYLASKYGLTFSEFTPLEVKMSICGYGQADKRQVAEMTSKLIKVINQPKHDDEWDAIAIGLTGLAHLKYSK